MALIFPFDGKHPNIAAGVFVAPNATIIGDVTIGAGASVWYGAVIRGDTGRIVIGENTNVQDNCVIHVNDRADTLIGANITIGHAAVVEGCTIGDFALIGMNATVLSGATVGERAIVAAGAVVRERSTIPPKKLAAGVPAKIVGDVSAEMLKRIEHAPGHYAQYGPRHQHAIDEANAST